MRRCGAPAPLYPAATVRDACDSVMTAGIGRTADLSKPPPVRHELAPPAGLAGAITAVHLETHTAAGQTETTTIVDQRYVGSCPADVKPGDLILPGGMKMNIVSP